MSMAPQNDEIAANAQSPDDSGPHDSFVYTPTEVRAAGQLFRC